MKKYLWRRREKLSEDMPLQITSMADIFTILLVFLLKSYSAGALNISPSNGVLLPVGQAPDSQVEALQLEVSQNSILIEGKPVSPLKEYLFDAKDLLAGGVSKSLSTALELQRKKQNTIAKTNASVKVDPKIIILADQEVPYGTLKSVLASAAIHGFTDFKLAIARGD